MSRRDRFPDPYKKVSWRGGRCDMIDKVAMQVLEDRLNATATIFQLGYSGDVSASAHTHDGGGAYDFWFPTVDGMRAARRGRDIGLDAWVRRPPTFPLHIHAIRHGSPTAHDEAEQQMHDYARGGDGLWPLTGGDDPDPYRPAPLRTFTRDDYYDELERRAREDRLEARLRRISRSIKHLFRKKRKTRRQLKRARH